MRKRMVGGSVTWSDGAENKAFSDGEVKMSDSNRQYF